MPQQIDQNLPILLIVASDLLAPNRAEVPDSGGRLAAAWLWTMTTERVTVYGDREGRGYEEAALSARHGRPRHAAATGQRPPSKPTSVRYRIVIHEIGDGDERPLADHTVEGYVAAIGRRLPNHQFEHKALRSGPLDLTLDLASVIPDAMGEFINKHLGPR